MPRKRESRLREFSISFRTSVQSARIRCFRRRPSKRSSRQRRLIVWTTLLFIFVAVQSGIAEARNANPEFRQGAAGYGRYYWHTYADYADENLWVEFLLPAALHQDSRYYTLGRGGFPKRLAYSFSRIAITRTDSGHEAFNASEIFGAGAAAGISGVYYPSTERTFTKTYQRLITSLAIDGGTFVFKEFWPDINKKFFHQK